MVWFFSIVRFDAFKMKNIIILSIISALWWDEWWKTSAIQIFQYNKPNALLMFVTRSLCIYPSLFLCWRHSLRKVFIWIIIAKFVLHDERFWCMSCYCTSGFMHPFHSSIFCCFLTVFAYRVADVMRFRFPLSDCRAFWMHIWFVGVADTIFSSIFFFMEKYCANETSEKFSKWVNSSVSTTS